MKYFFILLLSLFVITPTAFAADELDVDWEHDPLFDEVNFIPGDTETQEVRVENTHETEEADVYVNIDDITDDEFADVLKFYIIDKSSDKYLVGGQGDRFTLDEANNEGDLFIERLDAGESNRYIFKIRFDKEAGNEFQSREVEFDTDLILSSETPEEDELPLREGQEAGGNEAPEEEVAGALEEGTPTTTTSGEANPAVASASDCQSKPFWFWMIGLLLFALLFNIRKFFTNDFVERYFLIWQIVLLGGGLYGWYIVDACKESTWVPVSIGLVALLSFFFLRTGKK